MCRRADPKSHTVVRGFHGIRSQRVHVNLLDERLLVDLGGGEGSGLQCRFVAGGGGDDGASYIVAASIADGHQDLRRYWR